VTILLFYKTVKIQAPQNPVLQNSNETREEELHAANGYMYSIMQITTEIQ